MPLPIQIQFQDLILKKRWRLFTRVDQSLLRHRYAAKEFIEDLTRDTDSNDPDLFWTCIAFFLSPHFYCILDCSGIATVGHLVLYRQSWIG